MSINRSQAAALADGFLDDIGTNDKGELQPRETFTELFLLAGELVEDAQDNLNKDQSNASGGLSSSIKVLDPSESGNVVSCDIEMLFYGQFINSGVKGTKGGSGKYQFKSPFPSRAMVSALEKGINRAKKSTFNTSRRTISGNEKKNLNISDIQKAYGAARNIKMYGIKATGFMDKAIKTAADKADERLGSALKIDVINSLNDFTNNK